MQGPLTLGKMESVQVLSQKVVCSGSSFSRLILAAPGEPAKGRPEKNLRGQVPGGYKSTYLTGPSPDINPCGISNWERTGTKPKLPEGRTSPPVLPAYVPAVWTTLLLSKLPRHTQAPSPTVARHPGKTSGTKMPTCIPYCAYRYRHFPSCPNPCSLLEYHLCSALCSALLPKVQYPLKPISNMPFIHPEEMSAGYVMRNHLHHEPPGPCSKLLAVLMHFHHGEIVKFSISHHQPFTACFVECPRM